MSDRTLDWESGCVTVSVLIDSSKLKLKGLRLS